MCTCKCFSAVHICVIQLVLTFNWGLGILCKTRHNKKPESVHIHQASVHHEPFLPKLPTPTPTNSSPNDVFVNRIEIETKNIDYDSNILLDFRFRFRFSFFLITSISIQISGEFLILDFDFDYQPWIQVSSHCQEARSRIGILGTFENYELQMFICLIAELTILFIRKPKLFLNS